MNINFRTDILRQHKHARIRHQNRIGSQLAKLLKIRLRSFQIRIVRKNIRRHMHPDPVCMCKTNSFLHLFRTEVLGLRTQAESLASDVDSIRSVNNSRF